MREFNVLDTNTFRPFYYAAEALNFTEAAKRAGLTQSGVSQHVRKLEGQLGVPLFVRINKRVVLTEAGKKFRHYVEKYLDEVEALRECVSEEVVRLKGVVSYAMPASCLMTPHFPILLKDQQKLFPGVGLKVTLCPSGEVIERLLRLEIDFGFVTKHTHNPKVTFTRFCNEEYVLIGSDRALLSKISEKQIRGLPFVFHPGVEVLFEHWVRHHFPSLGNLTWDSLNVVGGINSLHGVVEMVREGLGLTVIPKHCALSAIEEKTIFEYRSRKPLLAPIYLVTLEGIEQPKRVKAVMDSFWRMHK